MTARLIVPESRRRPLRIAVALVLMMAAVLLAAGCFSLTSNKKIDEDIVLIRIIPDGSMAWMKTIDSGKTDVTKKVIQTSDGGYILAGAYSPPLCHTEVPGTPTIIRLSDSGEILWRKDYDLGRSGPVSFYLDQIAGIAQNPERGYSFVSLHGTVARLDPQGEPVWKKNLSRGGNEKYNAHYLLQNPCGSTIISGLVWNCTINPRTSWCEPDTEPTEPFVTKLDSEGNQVWFTKIPYFENYSYVKTLIPLPGNAGYIGLMSTDSGLRHLFRVSENGQLADPDQIDAISDVFQIASSPEGFSVISVNRSMNNTFVESSYTSQGKKTKATVLQNITRSDRIIGTNDGGYLSVQLITNVTSHIPRGIIVHTQEVNRQGEPVRDRQVTSIHLDSPNRAFLRDAIATTDGGYLLVLGVEKSKPC